MKRLLALSVVLAMCGAGLRAQVSLIDDNFDNNPLDNGWLANGVAVWVPPLDEAETCESLALTPNDLYGDGVGDCTLYAEEGYVLITSGAPVGAGGNIFRSEQASYDNFKMTITVELRDGSIGRPADGMCVVILETDDGAPPAGSGNAGGQMGATNFSNGQSHSEMIFEFDNWSCNAGDNNDQNHVGFTWSKHGFPNPTVDGICSPNLPGACRNDVFVKIPELLYPLNNKIAPPAPPNRFEMTVYVQNGTVACDLKAVDIGHDFGRVYTYKIADYEPFMGYLGVTGSTGGAQQNQILHDVKIESLPPGFCLSPPALVTRNILTTNVPETSSGDYSAGDLVSVELTLSDVRITDTNCTAPNSVLVKENPPVGWTPSAISDGGSFDAGTNTITWTVNSPALANGKKVTYKVTAADSTDLSASFTGLVVENIALSLPSSIQGEDTITKNTPFDACGGIRSWNILGAFVQPVSAWPDGAPGTGDNPGVDHMLLDFLTDGEIYETDFQWFPGAQISTAFGGDGLSDAVSTGLVNGAFGRNPNGVPQVIAWNDPDSTINLNDDVYGGDPNNVMAYMQCYVRNNGPDRDVTIASDSDDSIEIVLNGEVVWSNSVPRGNQDACTARDRTPDGVNFPGPITLLSGENSLIVKVFEGGGGWVGVVRFEDETAAPITDGLDIYKIPAGKCIAPAFQASRTIATTETVHIENSDLPRWKDGETYDVSIAISGIRGASGDCVAPTAVKVEETVPPGWVPSVPSSGGVVAANKITWNLTGAAIAAGNLTYKVKAVGASGTVTFSGKHSDPGSLATSVILGQKTLYNPSTFTDQCFITQWLLLGPYKQGSVLNAANPGVANIQRDHLTDGAGVTELNIQPKAGDTVNTKYGGAGGARSTGLEPTLAPINPGGIPTWSAWQAASDTVDFTTYDGGDENQVMHYAVCYLDVAADITVDIGLASDDSVQVLLDGSEIWVNNIPRGDGGPNVVEDLICSDSGGTACTDFIPPAGGAKSTTPVAALAPLTKGRHMLMVKVFEGGGAHTLRLRFQDPNDATIGVCDGISVCLDPNPANCGGAPTSPLFHRGDSDGNGAMQLTDAVRILNVLFLGVGSIGCKDAADADDNGSIQLTDAVRILNVLFLGVGVIPPPGSPLSPCGPDPGDTHLGCDSYDRC